MARLFLNKEGLLLQLALRVFKAHRPDFKSKDVTIQNIHTLKYLYMSSLDLDIIEDPNVKQKNTRVHMTLFDIDENVVDTIIVTKSRCEKNRFCLETGFKLHDFNYINTLKVIDILSRFNIETVDTVSI